MISELMFGRSGSNTILLGSRSESVKTVKVTALNPPGILHCMKLVVSIVHNRDRNRLSDELVKAGFKFTVIGSTGGFLREGNATLLTGIQDSEIDLFKQIVKDNCCAREQVVNVAPYETTTAAYMSSPVKVQVGGAVLFIMEVSDFVRF